MWCNSEIDNCKDAITREAFAQVKALAISRKQSGSDMCYKQAIFF